MANKNLVSINDFLASDPGVFLDPANLGPSGNPSLKIDPTRPNINPAFNAYTGPFGIKPGDHIIFKAYIKTAPPTAPGDVGERASGGVLGIDFYGSEGGINGTVMQNGQILFVPSGSTYVMFDTPNWTLRTMDFIVLPTYPFCVDSGLPYTTPHPEGTPMVPSQIWVWLQEWSALNSATERAAAWFADPELYINPTPIVQAGIPIWVIPVVLLGAGVLYLATKKK